MLPIIVAIVAVIGVGAYWFSSSSSSSSESISTGEVVTITESGSSQSGADTSLTEETQESEQAEGYSAYSPAAVAVATADDGTAVIFFHASWCPTCKAAEKDILSNVSDIPSDLTILKADYDTERELKQQYGVTYQHTFVQVDSEGNQITKWSGGGLDGIIDRVQEV